MEKSTAEALHKYILDNDLLTQVEARTKRKWSVGSRSTYYSGIKKCLEGERMSLVERLMISEAEQLMQESNLVPA